jgi:hypothetical protein
VLARNGVFVVLSLLTAVGPSIAISMFSYEFPTLIGECLSFLGFDVFSFDSFILGFLGLIVPVEYGDAIYLSLLSAFAATSTTFVYC